MDLPDVEKLLPPIVLGFGGVIPLLIAKPPFTVRDGLKPLMAVIFVLVVWATYLASYMLFTRWFYEYEITLWLLLIAVILFFGVYFLLRPGADESEKPGPWMFLLYAGAISILAGAAANYVGPKDWVVLDLRVLEPDGKHFLPISEVGYFIGPQKYTLKFTDIGHGVSSTLMQKALFAKLAVLKLKLGTKNSSDGKNLHDKYDVDKERLQLILHPSLTERFSATVTADYSTEE